MAATKTSRPGDVTAELAFLTRALKAPSLRRVGRPAGRTGPGRVVDATRSSWPPACNARSPPAKSHGGEGRIRAARFPARKSLEDFDFDHARGLKRDLIAHLGTLDFVAAKENVVFLGPPGTGKTHLAIGLGDPGLPGRTPGRVRHRRPMGRPPRRRPPRRPPAGRTGQARPLSRC